MKKMSLFFVAAIIFLNAHAAHAYTQVLVDEIMYDAAGADTGHEWIEVYNAGDTSINFTKWKFFDGTDNQKNHGIKSYKGSDVLSAGAYAIIATSGEKFFADHPDFAGTVFTSSFSLSNNGETIGLKDASANVIHQVTYTKDVGASGDGNSLQKIDGAWHVASPTLGETNAISSGTPAKNNPDTPTPALSATGSVKISGDLFAGETLGFAPEFSGAVPRGKLQWNFGDGTTTVKESPDVAEHAFAFSGTYTVVLADADDNIIGTTSAVITEKPALAEKINAEVKEIPIASTETIETNDAPASTEQRVTPTIIPLAAASAESHIRLSDWLVGLAAAIVIAVLGFRTFRKPKSEIVIPDDGIELVD